MFERAHRPAKIIIAEISRNFVHVDMAERDVAFEFRAPDEVRLKGAFGGRRMLSGRNPAGRRPVAGGQIGHRDRHAAGGEIARQSLFPQPNPRPRLPGSK